MAAAKTPGMQFKLVAPESSITSVIEENLSIDEETADSKSQKRDTQGESTEHTQTTEKTEIKEAITTRVEKKKVPKKPADHKEKKHKDVKPAEPPAPVVSQQTSEKASIELTNQGAGSTESETFQEWVAQLQYRINRYKVYPYQAKRRRLEGEVKIKIDINSDGTLGKVSMLAGKKGLEASSLKAIERSLPLPTPDDKPVTVILSINYRLLTRTPKPSHTMTIKPTSDRNPSKIHLQ
ncbi:energy transducer TonB [Endozoicomonas sp. 4G]|uniref:energy transducer TonB n=1 Tax=Endozoicomonas sp. 4G TaxID=2872754 RepID=UPI0020791A51|nr:energy transducer TonB [Endozoicomonas sp. 4G]